MHTLQEPTAKLLFHQVALTVPLLSTPDQTPPLYNVLVKSHHTLNFHQAFHPSNDTTLSTYRLGFGIIYPADFFFFQAPVAFLEGRVLVGDHIEYSYSAVYLARSSLNL